MHVVHIYVNFLRPIIYFLILQIIDTISFPSFLFFSTFAYIYLLLFSLSLSLSLSLKHTHTHSLSYTHSLFPILSNLRLSLSHRTSAAAAAAAVADASKLNQRLKEMFKERITSFRESVYLLTGYKV